MAEKKSFAAVTAFWTAAAAFITAADAVIKRIVMEHEVGEKLGELPGFFDFIYVRNTGAAFSIMTGMTAALGVVSVLFCIGVALFWAVKRPEKRSLRLALALLFAGALGNAIDRVLYGFVVDFISLKWFDFPVFNIADAAIVVGAAVFVIYVLFFDKEKGEKTDG